MQDLNELAFSELIGVYTARCGEVGRTADETFKTKEALIEAIRALGVAAAQPAPATGGTGAHDTSRKRGPRQGIGTFAKALLAQGQTNDEVLAAIKATFPDARTTNAGINAYRSMLRNPATSQRKRTPVQTPAALRAQAAELLNKANAIEEKSAAAQRQKEIEAEVRAELEARVRAEVAARLAAIPNSVEAAVGGM